MHKVVAALAGALLIGAGVTAAALPAEAPQDPPRSADGRAQPQSQPDGRGQTRGQGRANAMGWYLQLGDSLAAGYQPGAGAQPEAGYADDVLADLHEETGKTRLENLACPGETVVSLAEGGSCTYPKGSQLDQALHFLHAHGAKTRAITVTIGANDVVGCVLTGTLDPACVTEGMQDVATGLPQALEALRAAAPEAQIVVLNYYNPILAFWLQGEQGQQLAEASMPLQAQLNATIAGAAQASGAQVADVAAAFDSTDTTLVEHPELGTVPANVAQVCEWTWMCELGDIHARTAGYDVLGHTVAAVLGPEPGR